MNAIEKTLYDVSHVFLVPVLLLILVALAYSFIALGGFAWEALQRKRGTYSSALLKWHGREGGTTDDAELWILKKLELLRIVSRTAPMLGLVATMIPMGPALLALTKSDAQTVGENMVVAFSSVILALVSASLTFLIMTVRRRWLLEELRHFERMQETG